MSFRELTMIDVREVLRRLVAGQSARQLARDGVVDRKTAARYFEAARACSVTSQTELTDALVAEVAQRVQARPLTPPSDAREVLDAHRERIEAWLKAERPLRLVRVHELLAREGVDVGYTTLRRYAHGLGWRERPATVRVDDAPPGEEAQIDFGHMGWIVEDGKKVKLWALVVTLTMSRYMFVWPLLTQTTAALCEGLDAAWRFFSGVPKRVVPDNMSAAVVRPDAKTPGLQRAFLEYAQARGFFVDPARVRRPQDKARVENQIPYVRERCFDGEALSSVAAAREHAARWCRDIAGARVHGSTRRVPREVYEQEEKAHMLPAPTDIFDVPKWTSAKVHPDHHVQVAKALYSVPTKYVGRTVDVRLDQRSVRIYEATELVKTHRRVAEGKRSTDPNDYPVAKVPYATRSVERLVEDARKRGAAVGDFVARLLDGPLPWVKMRQAYGVMRLCERYGEARVDAVCARALAFDVLDVTRVERMLKHASIAEADGAESGRVVPLPAGRFARDTTSFVTRSTSESGGGR
jgi:transposase